MKLRTLALAVGLVAGGAAIAHADDKADALYKKGKRLLEEKHYAEACAALEDSNRLDPGIGIQLNIAHCYEEWGKLGTAYHRYVDAQTLAKKNHDSRVDRIHERIKAIEDQVPRLVVRVPRGASTDGLVVMIDGTDLPLDQLGQPQLTDPGPHTIDYKIGDTAKREMIVPVEAGETRETKIPLRALEVSEQVHPTAPAKSEGGARVGHTQRIVGIVVASAGVVGIGVSVGIGLSARSKYRDALSSDCMGMTDDCTPAGLTATHNARSEANIGTVVFGVGVAAVAAGAVVYFIAPKGNRAEHADSEESAWYVTPTFSGDGAGLAFGGRL